MMDSVLMDGITPSTQLNRGCTQWSSSAQDSWLSIQEITAVHQLTYSAASGDAAMWATCFGRSRPTATCGGVEGAPPLWPSIPAPAAAGIRLGSTNCPAPRGVPDTAAENFVPRPPVADALPEGIPTPGGEGIEDGEEIGDVSMMSAAVKLPSISYTPSPRPLAPCPPSLSRLASLALLATSAAPACCLCFCW